MIIKEKNDPKIFKIFKIFKKREIKKPVENCPMFSLRSNSIAVRYRSQLGGSFWLFLFEMPMQQKQL